MAASTTHSGRWPLGTPRSVTSSQSLPLAALRPAPLMGAGRSFSFWGQRVVVTAGRVVVVVDVDAAPNAVTATTRPPRTHGTSRRMSTIQPTAVQGFDL